MKQGLQQHNVSVHYIVALCLLALYGGQVCPFLESLTVPQLILPMAVVLCLMFVARFYLFQRWVKPSDFKQQVHHSFIVDFALFVLGGIILMVFNTLAYDFPLLSGLKIIVAMTGFGFLIASDLALSYERKLADKLLEKSIYIEPDSGYFPLTQKFALFASVAVLLIVAVLFLVVNKDLVWLLDRDVEIGLAKARLIILGEISFVMGLILVYLLKVILNYADNLKHFFHRQNTTLAAVTSGDLQQTVPVTSNDEFGVMALHTNTMISGLATKTQEVQDTRDVCILGLATLAETRDNETGAHILRTQRYVKVLAETLRDQQSRYQQELSDEVIDLLYKSAPLHDVGKVGIPDNILLKPGKLTDDEFVIMKTHAALGAEALEVAGRQLGGSSFLIFARDIAQAHHEKWDGSGYPKGLAGDLIPLAGRLMALADVYDALISKRVYKPAFSHEKARGIILEGRGSHFDPEVVAAFETCEADFVKIAADFADQS